MVGNKVYKIQSSVYLTTLSVDKIMQRRWETKEWQWSIGGNDTDRENAQTIGQKTLFITYPTAMACDRTRLFAMTGRWLAPRITACLKIQLSY